MKLYKKTYHFFSVLTLILFISGVVFPISLSAASLFCEMDMSVMQHGSLSCCDVHGADQYETTISLDKTSCNYQQVCEQAVSDSQTSIEAVPQITQNFTATLVTQDISPGVPDYSRSTVSRSEPISPEATPPIFLLNSTFLN